MRPDIKPGAAFRDYELPDHENVPRRLSELQGDDPMIPYTLVLKPGLVVHRIHNGYWFWGRPSFVDLWHDVRDLTRQIRPDWDLATPGLREAWDAGDWDPFHGWDRRAPDAMPARL
jgi:hypothetical protein